MKLTRRSLTPRPRPPALAAPAYGHSRRRDRRQRRGAGTAHWRHGAVAVRRHQIPEGFKHYDYVNPAAPQGGTVRQIAFGTFDNFNPVVAGVKGNMASGLELLNEDADDPGARRGLDRIRLAGGSGQLSATISPR